MKSLFENRCDISVSNCENKVYNFCEDNIPDGMKKVREDIKAKYCKDHGL